jgi:tetraacyldisaccharide 4'-kinase
LRSGVPDFWLHGGWLSILLSPLTALYATAVRLRRAAYRFGVLRAVRLPVPVIVVGNLFVGGSGKTPLVLWLVEELQRRGYRPGVVMRGYGSRRQDSPRLVDASASAEEVGDEALLVARRGQCPVAISARRPEAARLLADRFTVDVIVSDDGLQHYRLGRDIEIAVIDADRELGNGHCLPMGPLREPPSRLRSVDLVVYNGSGSGERPCRFELVPRAPRPVCPSESGPEPKAGGTVHAVAGIGNPDRFFATVKKMGFGVIPHPFPDHHRFRANDLRFGDSAPVLMTEKDAVKCTGLGVSGLWYVPVSLAPSEDLAVAVESLLTRIAAPMETAAGSE